VKTCSHNLEVQVDKVESNAESSFDSKDEASPKHWLSHRHSVIGRSSSRSHSLQEITGS
jgi:hypothetical protein